MSVTPNIGLKTTPEETSKSFLEWRLELTDETNSNMSKIDDAFGETTEKISQIESDAVSMRVENSTLIVGKVGVNK